MCHHILTKLFQLTSNQGNNIHDVFVDLPVISSLSLYYVTICGSGGRLTGEDGIASREKLTMHEAKLTISQWGMSF